jgi:ATP-dependent RNA helicase DDX54/DBP10
LIVTDLAARGIDIPFLDNVIHYDFPPTMKLFIHRSGRTARNGQKGTSYTILTKEEIPYMHDLSIYIGRKYYDCPAITDSGLELTLDDILDDPQRMCFGKLPQSVIDEYSLLHNSLHERFPTLLDPLKRSLELSLLKYNKNRDAASQSAVTATRNLLMPRVHPMLVNKVDSHEEELDNFKESIRQFKPKQSVLEIGLIKSMDPNRLNKFQ